MPGYGLGNFIFALGVDLLRFLLHAGLSTCLYKCLRCNPSWSDCGDSITHDEHCFRAVLFFCPCPSLIPCYFLAFGNGDYEDVGIAPIYSCIMWIFFAALQMYV